MSLFQITWDEVGERHFEAGVDRGVLYPEQGPGVPWNGLISVQEKPIGGEVEPYYFDGVRYMTVIAYEEFSATIEAFYYPEEFEECDGSTELGTGISALHQPRKSFGLCYRTKIGNDLDLLDHGYKIHLVYGAVVSPSDKSWGTVSTSLSPSNFSWDISATPIRVQGVRPTAHFIIDSTKLTPEALEQIENILYGTGTDDPRLLTAEELVHLAAPSGGITIFDNGDGTWTAIGPDSDISVAGGQFEITNANATYLDADTYEISNS
jgi:hypothetical protein